MSASEAVNEILAARPNLQKARQEASRRIEEARAILEPHKADGFDIVGFGSLARREITAESDFDYLVLATEMPTDPDLAIGLLNAADELRHRWATEDGQAQNGPRPVKGPGSSGVFACAVGAFDLVHQIGLQEDTNHSLTRRMLLLEESVSLLNGAVHSNVIHATLRRYLELGQSQPAKVPRFLLNDVTRYWHTITVDFQAKARTGPDEAGLRYLKLIIPRKILYAGTLMSLLLAGHDGWHPATAEALVDQFAMTPLERLVQGVATAPKHVQDAMEGVVEVADHFLELSGDKQWRDLMKSSRKGGPSAPGFDDMRDKANVLQSHLETIFFDWDLINERSRRALVF